MPPNGPRGPIWTRGVQKPRSLTRAMSDLLAYMGGERRAVLMGILCSLVGSALALIGPQYLEDIADSIQDSIASGVDIDVGSIASVGILLIIIYSLSALMNTAESYIIGSASERVGSRMRGDIFRKFNSLPLSYLESHNIGDQMSRMTNDTDSVRTGSAESFSTSVNAVVMLVGASAMMLYTNTTLAVFVFIPTLVGILVLYTVTRRTQKYFVAQQADLGRINSLVEEVYYGHDIVRAYNNVPDDLERFGEMNQSLFVSSFRARLITSMMPQMMHFISNLSYVVVCVVGSALIAAGSIGYGAVVAFIVYIKMFNHPVAEIADIIARMQSVASASERVFSFLSEPEMDDSPPKDGFTRSEGLVEFRNVHFGYTPEREVIHGFDLTVHPGSVIAIVGPTGAGKTTLVNLLMRFYEVDSGSIMIDGIPISEMSRAQVHDQFSMVLQDTWLFDGTFRENIVFTTPDVSDERVREACRTVGIADYIESLPQGYDTAIGDSSGLSVGQRQQIAIARAIVKDAPMIILDEATSSVDSRTERRMQAAMDALTGGRTSFIIAHRLSTVRNADKIIVFVDGKVVESGTHDQLMDSEGYYKMLYDSQFEGCD